MRININKILEMFNNKQYTFIECMNQWKAIFSKLDEDNQVIILCLLLPVGVFHYDNDTSNKEPNC